MAASKAAYWHSLQFENAFWSTPNSSGRSLTGFLEQAAPDKLLSGFQLMNSSLFAFANECIQFRREEAVGLVANILLFMPVSLYLPLYMLPFVCLFRRLFHSSCHSIPLHSPYEVIYHSPFDSLRMPSVSLLTLIIACISMNSTQTTRNDSGDSNFSKLVRS